MLNSALQLLYFVTLASVTLHFIGLSKERPILGDNRKAHSEKRCAFHEKQH